MAAVVYGISRFHHLLCGRANSRCQWLQAPSDDFPKTDTCGAPQTAENAPQNPVVWFQVGHNHPGEQMTLSDTLSRLPTNSSDVNIDLDQQVNVITLAEVCCLNIDLMNFSAIKQHQLKEETTSVFRFSPEQPWPSNLHWLVGNHPRMAHGDMPVLELQRRACCGVLHYLQRPPGPHTKTLETWDPPSTAQRTPRHWEI